MALVDEIKATGERLQKAIQDAKKAAPPAGATAEQREAFNRHTAAAHAIGLELQNLRGQQELEALEQQSQGALEPELAEVHSTLAAPGGSGKWASGDTRIAVQPEQLDRFARQRRDARLLSQQEYQERFGITREAHVAGMKAYLRSRGTVREARADAIEAIKHSMGKAGGFEKHLHSITDDGLGGFTVGDDFRAQIIRALPGFSVLRASGARVIQTSKPSVSFPVLNRASANPKIYTSDLTQGAANWRSEGATSGGTARTPQNKPTFGLEEIPVHIWQPDPPEITQQLLEDTDVDLEGLLADLFAETLGFDTDLAFIRGDGVGLPEGIVNSGATQVAVADTSTYAAPAAGDNGFSYQRIINIYTSLAAQYRQRAVWYFNSDTLGRLLSLGTGASGGDQHPLFPVNSVPGTLFNRPMYFTEFLDSGSTTGNVPILFGDPSYYVIAERRQLGIVRLVERYAPNIALQPTARIGGQLVLKEAFRIGTASDL